MSASEGGLSPPTPPVRLANTVHDYPRSSPSPHRALVPSGRHSFKKMECHPCTNESKDSSLQPKAIQCADKYVNYCYFQRGRTTLKNHLYYPFLAYDAILHLKKNATKADPRKTDFQGLSPLTFIYVKKSFQHSSISSSIINILSVPHELRPCFPPHTWPQSPAHSIYCVANVKESNDKFVWCRKTKTQTISIQAT